MATKVFAEFSPSCKREYADWIADAKRPETKAKRVKQAVGWIAQGKQRNWKLPADGRAAVRAVFDELSKDYPKSDEEMIGWYKALRGLPFAEISERVP